MYRIEAVLLVHRPEAVASDLHRAVDCPHPDVAVPVFGNTIYFVIAETTSLGVYSSWFDVLFIIWMELDKVRICARPGVCRRKIRRCRIPNRSRLHDCKRS